MPIDPKLFGAALQFAIQELGGVVNEQVSSVQVGTTATVVLAGNGDRVVLGFINPSANNVFIWLDSTVSSTNGILLSANGGSATFTVRDDFSLPARAWYAIAIGGSVNISIIELERIGEDVDLQTP